MNKFSDGKDYKVIAVCVPRIQEPNASRFVKQMARKCRDHNIKMLIFASLSDFYYGGLNDIGEAYIFSAFDPARFDAVVVMSECFKKDDIHNNIVNRARSAGVPIVNVDRDIEGCYSIVYGYVTAFEEIMEHVIDKHGCKRINLIAGSQGNSFSEARVECYKRILKERGIPFEEERLGYGDFWSEPGTRRVIDAFVKSKLEFPEAIVCANDSMAIEACRILKEYGYRVPEDVIVTGFDGIELEAYFTPRLTTAEFDIDGTGDAIFEALDEIFAGRRTEGRKVVEYKFRLGGSCGCGPMSPEGVEEQLYKEQFLTNNRTHFYDSMYAMVDKMSNSSDMKAVFDSLPEYFTPTKMKECWMCFNSDFIDEGMNIQPENAQKRDFSHYTSNMMVPMHSIGMSVRSENAIKLDEIIPGLDKALARQDYLTLFPMHLQGYTIGYLVGAFNAEHFEYEYFHAFLLNFRHILEIYVNRSTQERLYITDTLTGAYNRHGLYKSIASMVRKSGTEGIPFTVISIDMDGLKYINDTFGHAEGDFAIKTIAGYMLDAVKSREMVTRFGGDEFLITFCEPGGESRAEEIKKEFFDRIKDFNLSAHKPYVLGASLGIYSKIMDAETSLDEMIRIADGLMYEQKKRHKEEGRHG